MPLFLSNIELLYSNSYRRLVEVCEALLSLEALTGSTRPRLMANLHCVDGQNEQLSASASLDSEIAALLHPARLGSARAHKSWWCGRPYVRDRSCTARMSYTLQQV
jgi:hypothetical protein